MAAILSRPQCVNKLDQLDPLIKDQSEQSSVAYNFFWHKILKLMGHVVRTAISIWLIDQANQIW